MSINTNKIKNWLFYKTLAPLLELAGKDPEFEKFLWPIGGKKFYLAKIKKFFSFISNNAIIAGIISGLIVVLFTAWFMKD